MTLPGPPPFSWTGGGIHPEVIAGAGLLTGLYAGAWLLHRGPRPWHLPVLFGGGVLALVLALNGPLHDLSDYYLFSAHMVQHLVLTLVVPTLLLAGTPRWMADAVLSPVLAWRPTAALARVVTRPLPALGIYATTMAAWHLPPLYGHALDVHAWHVVQHLTMLITATVAWWPILSPASRLPALPYAAQLLYVFVFGIPMTVVAALITNADDVLYPFYETAPRLFALTPLEDQRLGGLIMWVPAGLVPLLVFTVVYFRWVAAEAEEFA
jgi:putative membrane protein